MNENKLIKLKDSDLYCIEAYKYGENFKIEDNNLKYWGDQDGYFCDDFRWVEVDLPEGNWQTLGTMKSETDLSFDPANYLERKILNDTSRGKALVFRDYNNGSESFIQSEIESLISLLSLNGKYWKNPMGKEPNYNDYKFASMLHEYDEDYDGWQSFEDNLIRGQLVFLIKNK